MTQRNQLISMLRFALGSKVIIASIGALLLGLIVGWSIFIAQGSHAEAAALRDNDDNAIVKGGTITKGEFVDKYNADKSGELEQIYHEFGLSKSELGRFEKTAKAGVVYKDGRVEVDGKVVATDAKSLGRQNMAGSSKKVIDGKTYYLRDTSVSFARDSLPALVMFGENGMPEFVVVTACGNPVTFTPKKPPTPQNAKCTALIRREIDRDSYAFSTEVELSGGAKVTKVVYDFGDKSAAKTETSTSKEVEHTYKPGRYTAKVTVHFTVDGKAQTDECTKPIEVKETPSKPEPVCTLLTPVKIDTNKYRFVAEANLGDDTKVKLLSGDFDFGDGSSAKGLEATSKNTAVAEHLYAQAKDYTITATLFFDITGQNGSTKTSCATKLTVPTVPATPCPVPGKEHLPKDSPECKETTPPSELPKSGPAQVIGGAAGLSSLAGAGYYWRNSRRDLIKRLLRRQ